MVLFGLEFRGVSAVKSKTRRKTIPLKNNRDCASVFSHHFSIHLQQMSEMGPLLLAWLVGSVSGFVVSIPVGPINITIVNEGARRGFGWAFWIGMGAVVMEVISCAVAFAGFSGLFASELIHAVMELT